MTAIIHNYLQFNLTEESDESEYKEHHEYLKQIFLNLARQTEGCPLGKAFGAIFVPVLT